MRDYALSLACLRRDLPVFHRRGYDHLPANILNLFIDCFVTSLEPDELFRALRCTIDALLSENDKVDEIAREVESQLRELQKVWDNKR